MKKHSKSAPECIKITPGSSQGALGTSQRGLVALLGHPNCRLEGSWGGLGSSLEPLGGVLGPRWPFFWRLGGSPGLLFGDMLPPRGGFAAKTVKSLILMTLSNELLTFKARRLENEVKIASRSSRGTLGRQNGALGGHEAPKDRVLEAPGSPWDAQIDPSGATVHIGRAASG
jgi:hypothetical protein